MRMLRLSLCGMMRRLHCLRLYMHCLALIECVITSLQVCACLLANPAFEKSNRNLLNPLQYARVCQPNNPIMRTLRTPLQYARVS